VEAVTHELFWGNIVSDVAALLSVIDQISDHSAESLFGSSDMSLSVHEGCEFCVVVPA
jgi:hypothetical protein